MTDRTSRTDASGSGTAPAADLGEAEVPARPVVMSDAGYRRRWEGLQLEFVDDPLRTVESADALLGEVTDEVARRLVARRRELAAGWRDGESSTEDLRLALQAYRVAIEHILTPDA